MSAREEILARLRPADPRASGIEAAALLIAPERPEVDVSGLEATFLDRLSLPSIAATYDIIEDVAALPDAVAAYLATHDLPQRLLLPPDVRVNAADWSGWTLSKSVAPDETAVLALARCGVAETGSLIFETAPDAPMLPNFLALHHIVLLSADSIVPHLEDSRTDASPPRALYWVTGVSGTTDIEGTYVRGAHGPRYLHVILVRCRL